MWMVKGNQVCSVRSGSRTADPSSADTQTAPFQVWLAGLSVAPRLHRRVLHAFADYVRHALRSLYNLGHGPTGSLSWHTSRSKPHSVPVMSSGNFVIRSFMAFPFFLGCLFLRTTNIVREKRNAVLF